MTTTLPLGFRARVRTDIRVADKGRTLVGGSPVRVLRLKPPAPAIRAGTVLEVSDSTSDVVVARLLEADLAEPLLESRPGLDGDADLTVVIPVRDRAARLDRLLDALGGRLPVVVVDDASGDPESVHAVVHRHTARLVALTENLGPAGARNRGLAEVSTSLVAFVDSDVVVTANTLVGLTGHFADHRVAMVGPRVRGATSGERPNRFEQWDRDGLSLDLGEVAALVRPWSRVSWLPGACLVGRTADVTELGGFEEGRRVAEDVDLVWRLLQQGRLVRYDPAFVADHDSRTTWTSWLGRRMFYGTGGAWLANRHRGWMAPAVLSPLSVVAAGALLVQRRWSVPVAGLALLGVRHRLRRTLPDTPDRPLIADALVKDVTVSTLRQTCHLLLRHWWPGVALTALVSHRVRRAVLVSLVWDALDHLAAGPGEFIARRLDDLAYGAGLWSGAARARSVRVLVPHISRRAAAGASSQGSHPSAALPSRPQSPGWSAVSRSE